MFIFSTFQNCQKLFNETPDFIWISTAKLSIIWCSVLRCYWTNSLENFFSRSLLKCKINSIAFRWHFQECEKFYWKKYQDMAMKWNLLSIEYMRKIQSLWILCGSTHLHTIATTSIKSKFQGGSKVYNNWFMWRTQAEIQWNSRGYFNLAYLFICIWFGFVNGIMEKNACEQRLLLR